MAHWFTLTLDDTRRVFDLPTEEQFEDAIGQIADDLFEAGCDDGTFFVRQGVMYVGFAREAATLREAIVSAIQNVQSTGLRVSHVGLDTPPEIDDINAQLGTGSLATA